MPIPNRGTGLWRAMEKEIKHLITAYAFFGRNYSSSCGFLGFSSNKIMVSGNINSLSFSLHNISIDRSSFLSIVSFCICLI